MKKNILVFPCGSEVALEIHRSLAGSTHFNLFGASSVKDHGEFVYENYIGGLPFITESNFIGVIKNIVLDYNIHAIFPAMDAVMHRLKENEGKIGCKVVSSPKKTTEICLSKLKTYEMLHEVVETPIIYESIEHITQFPVFLKPEVGYGSRGVKKADSQNDIIEHSRAFPNCLILEYLPGPEFTVDCFTDANGKLLFSGARERSRILNGISVNTTTKKPESRFIKIARGINNTITFQGAWFFQVKERKDGTLVLMEIAARMGGSSCVYRMKGINFAQLSLFNAFGVPVSIIENNYHVELDRALDCKYKTDFSYENVYIDFDDCIYSEQIGFNLDIMKFIFKCKNKKIKIILITKHDGNLKAKLQELKILDVFDGIIHLKQGENKSNFINRDSSIFIDDSYSERREVFEKLGVPVFSVDMVEVLL